MRRWREIPLTRCLRGISEMWLEPWQAHAWVAAMALVGIEWRGWGIELHAGAVVHGCTSVL